jgi:hypothetical protein
MQELTVNASSIFMLQQRRHLVGGLSHELWGEVNCLRMGVVSYSLAAPIFFQISHSSSQISSDLVTLCKLAQV